MGLSAAAGVLVMGTGLLVLAGWLLEIEELKRVGRGYVAMNPFTAICFVLLGLCLLLQHHPRPGPKLVASLISLAVFLACLLKFISVFFFWDFPLDRLLFLSQLREEGHGLENRMAPNTAFCFILASLSLLLLDVETARKKRPAQFLTILITLIALLSVYGYVYGVRYLFGIAAYIPMALHTALAFLVLAIGLLFARPDKGSMLLLFSEDTESKLFARLGALVLPLFFGWLKLKGQRAGLYSQEFGTTLFSMLTYTITMVLLGRNALERHRAKKEKFRADYILKENARKLQSILDNTATPIYIKDPSGRFELVNAEFGRVFQVGPEKITGKTDQEVLPGPVAATFENHDRQVMASGQTHYLEEVFSVGPEEKTYLTVKFPLRDAKGQMNALCSIATDITERKKAETELRQSHQMLQAILASLGEGVVVTDAQGRFTYFNRVAEDLLGLGITDTPLENWSLRYGSFRPDGVTLFPPEELPLARGLKGEATDDVELFVRNENIPKGRFIKVTGRPIFDDQQHIIGSVVVCRDIDKEKKVEKAFQRLRGRYRKMFRQKPGAGPGRQGA
ncbi:MAG: PAS domain-containing protein [Adhaeribacter sp.]